MFLLHSFITVPWWNHTIARLLWMPLVIALIPLAPSNLLHGNSVEPDIRKGSVRDYNTNNDNDWPSDIGRDILLRAQQLRQIEMQVYRVALPERKVVQELLDSITAIPVNTTGTQFDAERFLHDIRERLDNSKIARVSLSLGHGDLAYSWAGWDETEQAFVLREEGALIDGNYHRVNHRSRSVVRGQQAKMWHEIELPLRLDLLDLGFVPWIESGISPLDYLARFSFREGKDGTIFMGTQNGLHSGYHLKRDDGSFVVTRRETTNPNDPDFRSIALYRYFEPIESTALEFPKVCLLFNDYGVESSAELYLVEFINKISDDNRPYKFELKDVFVE